MVISSRMCIEGKLTTTQPIDSRRFSMPDIPLRPAPPTIVSAASKTEFLDSSFDDEIASVTADRGWKPKLGGEKQGLADYTKYQNRRTGGFERAYP